jgi:hypothetical protein
MSQVSSLDVKEINHIFDSVYGIKPSSGRTKILYRIIDHIREYEGCYDLPEGMSRAQYWMSHEGILEAILKLQKKQNKEQK